MRSLEHEMLDTQAVNISELRKNLKEFEFFNKIFGSSRTLHNALQKIFKRFGHDLACRKIVIIDVGCGAGDALKNIYHWAKSHQLDCQIIGVDNNPMIIQYAAKQTADYPNIECYLLDIITCHTDFTVELGISNKDLSNKPFAITCLNNVCHHFSDEEIELLYQKLISLTEYALIINDLERSRLAYYGIYWWTRLFGCSTLAKNDGPLSVMKGFKRYELLAAATRTKTHDFSLSWFALFRWQLILWCSV